MLRKLSVQVPALAARFSTVAAASSSLPSRADAALKKFVASGSNGSSGNGNNHNNSDNQSGNRRWGFKAAAAAAGLGMFTYYKVVGDEGQIALAAKPAIDYDQVRKDIALALDNADWEDGSYGPLVVRLAWHCAGTYDKTTGTGGSNGALMRFLPESGWGANAGLATARDLLRPIKEKYGDALSYADLWTLAGTVAIEAMGGPVIPWRPGRLDAPSSNVPTQAPDGTLPDASQGCPHLRSIFNRMGFGDKEIVALSGAHCLGRCHTDRSGYEGPWTFAPTTFSNDYFKLLLSETWIERKWDGPRQFQDKATGSLMMLPSDLALLDDPSMRKWVEAYAKDEKLFFDDFAGAWRKLMELGVY